jgi:lipid II:glycine glycyltransferase (peptidoglycan interpeptide bridge formation enzyme)
VAGAQILFRPLPLGLGSVAYLPKGPLVDWSDVEQCRYVLTLCTEAARARHALFMQIEPDLPESDHAVRTLKDLGLSRGKHSVQPRGTLIVDLTPSEEDIIAGMKQKTRYNIRLAERRGVSVRAATPETAEADLAEFQRLLQDTGQRGSFGVHSAEYHRSAYRLFAAGQQVALLLAEYQSRPLAAVMIFAFGERSWYFYGASSVEERERMPAYALQWAAMRWAKACGCSSYDLWGVPDVEADVLESEFATRTDGLWPVYRFKRGFGGQLKRNTGAWERVYLPWAHRLYKRFIAARSGVQA